MKKVLVERTISSVNEVDRIAAEIKRQILDNRVTKVRILVVNETDQGPEEKCNLRPIID